MVLSGNKMPMLSLVLLQLLGAGTFGCQSKATQNARGQTQSLPEQVQSTASLSEETGEASPIGSNPRVSPIEANTPDSILTSPQGQVSAVALSGTDVIVEWKKSRSPVDSLIVERRSLPAGEWIQLARLSGDARLYRDQGLTAKTQYEYRVLSSTQDNIVLIDTTAPIRTDDPASPSVFHVSSANGSDKNPGTEQLPWKTLQYAHGKLKPGQTLLVGTGEYKSTNYAVLAITKSGTPDAWITYRNFPGQSPKIVSTVRKNWSGIEVRQASYIVIEGFELAGHSKDVTLEGALAEMRKPTPYASSSGISVESRDLSKPIAHHIVVRNNYIHDHPLNGVAMMGADYVTVEDNRIHNNGRFSSYGGSGISVLVPRDSDSNTRDYKFIVRRNASSSNSNEVPCGCYKYRQPTDGNGIILDTYRDYKGRTLVVNNLVHNNGARGIHVFHASNVDVFFNTSVRNSTIPITGDGEITAIESKNVRVRDNIMVARSDRPVNSTRNSENVDFSHNIVYGGNGFVATGNDSNRLNVDPLFVAEGTHSDYFALKPESPAVNNASGTVPEPGDDLFRMPRKLGSKADVGAIESH
ncbi:MAG TPA: right-handed parallel beta-helix repeat-containing protein [Oligoflexus sp.]|uniref:right-handed parallel beta-helix repeat-containing protein n=1 Tax=Oligoflexus sp. TaxID=1971216 RepID=UPI002D3CDC0F|nr:right-handed parallel beta-helix repeat-containing protein [Oligoflexus sp.]HYX33357.1 right-handed parallel beta-helix repeat-containing protein [Oligoflexus sp.]